MGPFSRAIHKQGTLLLSNQQYAYMIVALLAATPFLTWLSVTIAALITLRKGPDLGIKVMGIGMLSLLFITVITTSLSAVNLTLIVLTYLPVYVAAILLRNTSQWEWVACFMLGLASAFILFLSISTPDFLMVEYHALQHMLKDLQGNDVQILSWLGSPSQIMAYLLGIQALTFMISSLSTLILARAIQAKLFYPEGFRQEILSFQAYHLTLIPFVLILYGAYQHTPIAISLLPIWLCYFAVAGLCVIITLFATHKPMLTFSLLLVSIILLPIVMLPMMTTLGILDSFFHFRRRFVNSKPKKH